MICINKIEEQIIEDYYKYIPFKEICEKYNIPKWKINHIVERNNLTPRRFLQQYNIVGDHCEILIRSYGKILKCLIDIDDIDKCKQFGIWSITKDGYIINCKTGTYLHRFIMNCPNDLEVDHIYHNLLDNRKSQLRISTSKQQKFNTKTRIDNTSGHRGVYWDNPRQKWHVNIKNGDMRINKRFDDYKKACEFVDKKFTEWHGDFKYDGYIK